MNNIMDYLNAIEESDINNFLNQTKSDILVKRDIEKVVSDTSWIDMVEESIPYLDNIIRNPRRFIVQEENIVPIEKAKVVTEESIKHLAQNTNLIQEVQEDGMIIPLKLLNVYREETMDLYENRFIKSLVDNLYQFVENKLSESDQKSYAKISNFVTFEGVHKAGKETIKVNLNLESIFNDELNLSKDGVALETRIEHIRDVLGAFRSSTFIKGLKEASPVRSPIRKTNVILKEQNFIKALELWEFLEKNSLKPVTSVEKSHDELKDNGIKSKYEVAFFIEADALKENKVKQSNVLSSSYIAKLVNDFVMSGTVSEQDFKKILTKEFKEASKRKSGSVRDINKRLNDFINMFEKNKKKAMALLK